MRKRIGRPNAKEAAFYAATIIAILIGVVAPNDTTGTIAAVAATALAIFIIARVGVGQGVNDSRSAGRGPWRR
jgi:hypothetical protein